MFSYFRVGCMTYRAPAVSLIMAYMCLPVVEKAPHTSESKEQLAGGGILGVSKRLGEIAGEKA